MKHSETKINKKQDTLKTEESTKLNVKDLLTTTTNNLKAKESNALAAQKYNLEAINPKKASKGLSTGKAQRLAIRCEKSNLTYEEAEQFWNNLACCKKIDLLTFFSSELVK